MSSILGTLFVELKASTGQFVSDLGNASKAAKTVGKDIESSFSNLGNVAQSVLQSFGPFGAQISGTLTLVSAAARSATSDFSVLGGSMSAAAEAAAGASAGFAALGLGAIAIAARTADANAKLYEQAQSAGVSVEALSRLSYAARQVGVDQNALVRSLDFMQKAAFLSTTGNNNQAKAFADLGIKVTDATGAFKPADELFTEIAGKLAAMTDETKRTAIEALVLGKTGEQLAPLLNLGADAIENLEKKSDKLGATITEKAGKAAEQFKQNIADLTTEVGALAQEMTGVLLPGMIKFTGAFAEPTSAFPSSFPLSPARVASFGSQKAPALGSAANPNITVSGPIPGGANGAAPEATDGQVAAQKKLQDALKSTTEKLQEEIATYKLGTGAIEMYKLAALGASDADQQQVYKLGQKLDALKLNDEFKQRVVKTQADAAKAYEATAKAILDQVAALNALALEEEQKRDSGLLGLFGQRGGGAGLSDLTNPAYDAQNAFNTLSETIKSQIANHGKSDIELQIEDIAKLPGATPQQIDTLKQFDAQLKSLGDDTQKASGAWKQFGDVLARDLSSLGEKGQGLQKIFKDLLKTLQEDLIKEALFGNGFGKSGSGGLFGGLGGALGGSGKPGTTPPFFPAGTATGAGSATGGFLATIGKLFGLGGKGSTSSAVVRDGNTTGSSIYVTPVDAGGTVIDAQDQANAMADAGTAGAISAIPALSSTLKSLPSAAVTGGNIGGLLGGVAGGLLKLIPGLAGGGAMDAGALAIVGENGPELWAPDTAGRVVPMTSAASGGATTYNIDARGATDPAATAMAVRMAIAQSENRAVARARTDRQQQALRTPASAR